MNRLEIFNELSILVSSYHLFAFTALVDSPSVQYLIGWSLIGVIALNITVNMLIVAYSTYCSLKICIKRLLFRYRQWREKCKAKKYSCGPSDGRCDVRVNLEQEEELKVVSFEEEKKMEEKGGLR